MARTSNKRATKKTVDATGPIIIHEIKIGQLERGNQSIQKWMRNVKAAERILNPNRRFLLETFLDISIDLHLDSVQGKRIRALKNVPFEWPGLTDEKIIENLRSPWFYELVTIVGKSIFEGYKVAEVKLGPDGLINQCEEIPPQNVRPDKKIITREMWGSEEGAFPYTQPPLSYYIVEIGRPKDLGLYTKIAPYVLLKRDNLADFSRFNEMFGMPLRWYEYDPHDPVARQQVTEQAEAQGSAAYVVVPKGTIVNFHEANKTGSAETYGALHKILNDEITIGVLGQTLTTSTTGVGSNALGKVHMQVESELAMEDRLYFELFVNYVFKPQILLSHGYPLNDIRGSFTLTEEISMEKKLEMWLQMIDRGIPIAEEDFYEEFGVPLPDGRPVVIPPSSRPAPNADQNNNDPKEEENEDPGTDDGQPGGADDSPKLSSPVSGAVRKLYASQCKHRSAGYSISLSYTSALNDRIEEIIRKLFNREISAGDVDPDLWKLIEDELMKALEAGYTINPGRIVTGSPDANMLAALRKDVQIFSGFKTYQFLREATDLLTDPTTGSLRTFSDFRSEILKLNSEYNVNFLRAEYNHAVGAARMAGKWVEIVGDKEVYPLLEYITAGDSRVRQSHRKLDGVIKPMDDPFWDTYMPPNDWNCRCTVRKLMDGDVTITKPDELPQLKDEFKFNPGKQQVVFPKNHPYYNADQNFKLPGT